MSKQFGGRPWTLEEDEILLRESRKSVRTATEAWSRCAEATGRSISACAKRARVRRITAAVSGRQRRVCLRCRCSFITETRFNFICSVCALDPDYVDGPPREYTIAQLRSGHAAVTFR